MFYAIALRRSAVSMCQDTRITGICGVVLDSIKREQKSAHGKRMTRLLLKDLALTDLPMPDQQPVLYFGMRPAVLLFPAVVGLLHV